MITDLEKAAALGIPLGGQEQTFKPLPPGMDYPPRQPRSRDELRRIKGRRKIAKENRRRNRTQKRLASRGRR